MTIREYAARLSAETRKLGEALTAMVMKSVPDAEANLTCGNPTKNRG
jgi:hypothetical protein